MAEGTFWPSTHASLLERIRQVTDQAAWEEFITVYGPFIYRYCRKRGLPDSDAQDVTQEVFRQVSRAIGGFEYDRMRGRFRSWLGTVTRNEITRYLKKRSRPGRGAGGPSSEAAVEGVSGDLDASWLDEFTAHLCHVALARIRSHFDPVTWRAFEMLWLEDRSAQDVAKELGREPGWVYKAKFRVQRRLKEQIQALASDSVIFER